MEGSASPSWDEEEEWSLDEDDCQPTQLHVESLEHVPPEALTQIMRAEIYKHPPETYLTSQNVGCRPIVSLSSCRRIQTDIKDFHLNGAPPGIHLYMDEDRMELLHLVIEGPADTPYEAGLFLFLVDFTGIDYPTYPPRVKIVNTHDGQIRYNPNLYADGKVCLSIIGTWAGPGWMPSMTITSIALSIQSLLGENPLSNEPGYAKISVDSESAQQYNDECRYNTISGAVIFTLSVYIKRVSLPDDMVHKLKRIFRKNYTTYHKILDRIENKEGSPLKGQYFHASKSDMLTSQLVKVNPHVLKTLASKPTDRKLPVGPLSKFNEARLRLAKRAKEVADNRSKACLLLSPNDEPSVSGASGLSPLKKQKTSCTTQSIPSSNLPDSQPAKQSEPDLFDLLLNDDNEGDLLSSTVTTNTQSTATSTTQPDLLQQAALPSTSQASCSSSFTLKLTLPKKPDIPPHLVKKFKCNFCGYTGGKHMINCSSNKYMAAVFSNPHPIPSPKPPIDSQCSTFKIADCRKKLKELAEKYEDLEAKASSDKS